jgi:periplasmic protein TonB
MTSTLLAPVEPKAPPARRVGAPIREARFTLLEDARGGASLAGTLTFSLMIHAALVAAIIVVPLLLWNELAPTTTVVRTFFVAPPDVKAAPPPPPPPPPAARSRAQRAADVPTPPPRDDVLRAPVEVPQDLPPPEIDLGTDLGVEGGVAGGVEGGIAGGVVGGIVGGVVGNLPTPAPEPVRVGGHIKAPALLQRVEPLYPPLATRGRIQGTVIIEARVDDRGQVTEARVLRGLPLLDGAAVDAVRQWRYRPLLLNGQRWPFIVTVTVNFRLNEARTVD